MALPKFPGDVGARGRRARRVGALGLGAAGFVLALLARPVPARADLVLMPIEAVFVNPLIVFVGVVLLASAARLLLIGVRRFGGSVPEAPGEGRKGLPGVRVGAVLALLVFGLCLYVFVQEQRGRRERRKYPQAKSNLGAIRSLEVSYFAEWNVYVGNQPLTPLPERRHEPDKTPWQTSTRFSILGFAPEGEVWCSYALEGPDWPTEAEGFTARAECDLDNDGQVAVWTVNDASNEVLKAGAPF